MSAGERERLAVLWVAVCAAERGPNAADLAEAPVLDEWHAIYTPDREVRLCGEVSGHPTLGRAHAVTSRLLALDRGKGWARTLNRWYQLRRPAARTQVDIGRTRGSSLDRSGTQPLDMLLSMHGFKPVEDDAQLDRLLLAYRTLIRDIAADYGFDESVPPE